MQTARLIRFGAFAVATFSGCKVLDDDEPPPMDTAGADTGGDSCVALVEAACDPGMNVVMNYSVGGGKAVLIDDPHASVGVGPEAWLVKVESESDFVGVYHDGGEGCVFACFYCQPGQNLCHGGFDEQGLPRCWSCSSYDDPNAEESCTALQAACQQVDADDGSGGLDETGSGTTDAIGEYDCTTWRPKEGVRRDGGTIIVDGVMVEEAMLYQGEPLASCDDTRFRHRSDGYFEISRMADDGLLAAMGLARGDVILAVNGAPLNDLDTVMQVVSRISAASSFTITISRSGARLVSHVVIR